MELTTRWKTFLGISIIVSPVGLLLGWIVLMARAGQGPDTGWFISHALLLVGVILLLPAILGFRYLLGGQAPNTSDRVMGLAMLGALALIGQFTIDLAVGTITSSQPEMSDLLRKISAAPGMSLPFYVIGPIIMYGGTLIPIVFLLNRQLILRWAGLIAVIGIVVVGVGSFSGTAVITLLGFAGMAIGFAPIGWQFMRKS
jgi:hypothetical protein